MTIEEHVITGTVLLMSAAGWAAVAQRWALIPAAFAGAAGTMLLWFAPGDAAMSAMGWAWPTLTLAVVAVTLPRARRDLRRRTRRWLVYPLLGLYTLAAAGGAYEVWCERRDARTNQAPGELVDIGGRRLHVSCVGSGRPAVILQSGLGGTSTDWASVSAAVAGDTQVCAYDRAGRGGSDAAPSPQDGAAIAADLHALLERRHIQGPVVLAGHSSGAPFVRIFADRFPEQVAGVVLLDGQPAEAFERLPAFPLFYRVFRRVSALLPSLARLGVGRLLSPGSSPRQFRSLRDEFAQLPATLRQTHAAGRLGARPLIVLTATRDAMDGWLPLQEEMATLSTNAVHRMAPYTHSALIEDPGGAAVSARAIRDVVAAARTAGRFAQSAAHEHGVDVVQRAVAAQRAHVEEVEQAEPRRVEKRDQLGERIRTAEPLGDVRFRDDDGGVGERPRRTAQHFQLVAFRVDLQQVGRGVAPHHVVEPLHRHGNLGEGAHVAFGGAHGHEGIAQRQQAGAAWNAGIDVQRELAFRSAQGHGIDVGVMLARDALHRVGAGRVGIDEDESGAGKRTVEPWRPTRHTDVDHRSRFESPIGEEPHAVFLPVRILRNPAERDVR